LDYVYLLLSLTSMSSDCSVLKCHSWLITGFVTILTRRVPLVELELLTLPEHLSSSPVFSGVRVTRSLVLCVCFVDRCLSFCSLSFGHCIVCSSSIYRFWLPLWYLQTLLIEYEYKKRTGMRHLDTLWAISRRRQCKYIHYLV
jgi:hypothetical protein